MYKYKFVNRDKIIFTCDADHMTDALMKFNQWTNPLKHFYVEREFHFMCCINNGRETYGVTWSENK